MAQGDGIVLNSTSIYAIAPAPFRYSEYTSFGKSHSTLASLLHGAIFPPSQPGKDVSVQRHNAYRQHIERMLQENEDY